MPNRKGKFKVKNGSGSYDQVMLETILSQIIDSPIKSLERNTRYELNTICSEVTLPKGGFLICTQAGTTAASTASGFLDAAEGEVVTDGTAAFVVHYFDQIAFKSDFESLETIAVGDVIYRPYLKNGYVKANGATVNRVDYPNLVAFATSHSLWTSNPSSEPWKYGTGNGSTTMVLPDYRNRVIQGGDTAAVLAAGLPNIRGTMNDIPSGANNFSKTGAFTDSSQAETRWYLDANNSGQIRFLFPLSFNAANSNAIYGSADTVQPPALQLIPQIRY